MTYSAAASVTKVEEPWLLVVEDLAISFHRSGGRELRVVDGVSVRVRQGETFGLVGESGCGKTIFCRALLGTLDRHGARIVRGSLRYRNQQLATAPESIWRQLRGRHIAYVPQSSLASLNPVLTVGEQLASVIRLSSATPAANNPNVRTRAVELLDAVQIPRARDVLGLRPTHLSGGMRQRVAIAAAIARSPSILIADEPTTALDVRVQRRILDLLTDLRRQFGLALLLVSHDLAVVEEMCESLAVMYAGSVMETGDRERIMSDPKHPYTAGLLAATIGQTGTRVPIPGEVPSVGAWPVGCKFWPRCQLTHRLGGGPPKEECRTGGQPVLRNASGRMSACLFAGVFDASTYTEPLERAEL